MLTRPPSLLSRRCTRARWPGQAVDRAMNRWLKGSGSLTLRLRRLGAVQVQVQYQGTERLWRAERAAIGQTSGHVREVILMVDGQPMVWARSVTSLRAMRGPWRALRGLGSRPLAELLFSHARVKRGPLHAHSWARRGPERGRARRQLARHGAPSQAGMRWARASVFWHHGQPLRVMESFSPQLARHFTP